MTKPEFYLAPDGSMQPLPDSGPLTLTDGALSYPGREAAVEESPPVEQPERDPNPWAHGTLLRLTDASLMGTDMDSYTMVNGDVLIVDEDERRQHEDLNGVFAWGGRWTGARVRCLRNGEVAWAHLDCVEAIDAPTLADRTTWPQMQVGDKLHADPARRLSINPLIGMANRAFSPMRWSGHVEGGSFVIERVA